MAANCDSGEHEDSMRITQDILELDKDSRVMLRDWIRTRLHSDEKDELLSLYSYTRDRLFARDGFLPSDGPSRRASVDPARDEVIREIAKGLRANKSEMVFSFVKEWIQTSDDPSGMLSELGGSAPSGTSNLLSSPTQLDEVALDQLLSWDNDVLALSQKDLVSRSLSIFELWGFFGTQTASGRPIVDKTKFTGFLRVIAKNYRSENPYHNFHHAHSVLAVVGNILTKNCRGLFSDVEEFAILTAALCHDVGHRGLNSDYYVKTRHPLAMQYNDVSVLEHMHCSLTFDLLRESESRDFTKSWTDEQYMLFRRVVIQAILATDMKIHFELTANIQKLVGVDDMSSNENRKIVLQSIVHSADLANPVMGTKSCYEWAFRVVEEMYEQGRLEERDGFVVAPFMKHPPTETVEFAKLQMSFVEFIVAPLWRSMALVWPSLNDRVSQLESNMKFWKSLRDGRAESIDA
jgi:hypothetical protein